MRQTIDIRPLTERKPNSRTTTGLIVFHAQSGWVSYRVGTSKGWYVFNRLRTNGSLGKKWHIGFSMSFDKAISKARADSGRQIPTTSGGGWKRIEVKHYNFTNICEVEILNLITEGILKDTL